MVSPVAPPLAIAVASGRMLILSAFAATATRITAELAARRNEFVAALAEDVFIAHATVSGHVESLAGRLRAGKFRSTKNDVTPAPPPPGFQTPC